MKPFQTITVLLGLLTALNACTPKMSFLKSSIVPAASGSTNVKKDKNDNYTLKVSVRNLAQPRDLTPSKNTYIVWMKQDDNSVKKLGQLHPSGKALTATLNTASVVKPREVYITAEDNADIRYPAGQTVLTTER